MPLTLILCFSGIRIPAILLAVGISLAATAGAWAQNTGDREDAPPADTIGNHSSAPDFDLISAGLEYVPSPQGGDFFREYPSLGGEGDLEGYIMPSAMLRLASIGAIRVIIYGAVAGGEFTDIYDVRDSARGDLALASVVEKFSISSIPVMVGVEFSPIREQFTTYAGASAGMAYSSVEWTTSFREHSSIGFSRPITNIRGGAFHPVYRIYAGVDYRFDRNLWSRGPIRGIFLEGGFLGIPIRRDYFAAVRGAGKMLQGVPGVDDATLDIGGVTFTMGINLQFVRR